MTKEYDLVVLGGGTGGYVAAIRASQLGMQVALVEKRKLGGTCLHDGCITSKALLRTAELYRQFKSADEFGIEASPIQLNFINAQKRKKNIIDTLHQGVKSLLKKANVDVFYGYGRILGPSIFSPQPGTISIEYENGNDNTMIVPKYVLLATGSSPNSLPGIPIDGLKILHSDQAMQLETLPKSMLIIGGGVIGIEWASMLQDLGVKVTVVENKESILLEEDDDIRSEVQKALTKRGVQFITNASIQPETLSVREDGVVITVDHEGDQLELKNDQILVCVGRKANIDEIGINNTSIEVIDGVIKTNSMYQTKESHIYAIGDCIGGMQLAHVATAEGIIAVEHMSGKEPDIIDPLFVPSCIYAYPEVARIGLTEKTAKESGYSIKVGAFPFQG